MPFARLISSLLFLAALLTLSGCHHSDNSSPLVATAYDYELHLDDLSGLVGEGVSPDDSSTIMANYIDQWIRQMVILSKAEKNINDNFERQLREYKNSLLIYAYERQIVNQLLDTNVSDDQIADYYEQHSNEFRLKNAILKTVYVTVPSKSPALAKLKRTITKSPFDEEAVVELEATARRNGVTGYFDAESWIPFFNFQTAVPVTAYNEALFLRQNRTIQLTDDSVTYLARILDYKVVDEIAPLETQFEIIRSIILNHRKIDILNRLQSDLLDEAEKNGHVKRY